MSSTYDTSLFQLVHQTACTVVANGKLTLNQTGRAALFADNQTGCILEHRIEMLHIHVTALATFSVVGIGLRQFEGSEIALLVGDELVDALDLGCIHEGTLHADRFATVQIKHIASSYQLLGTWTVENGA